MGEDEIFAACFADQARKRLVAIEVGGGGLPQQEERDRGTGEGDAGQGRAGDARDRYSGMVREAFCPVIALLSTKDPTYVHEAAKRGVFAYIVDTTPEELQSTLDITLQRFTEYHNLKGAFARRAVIEQAKGVLMARHGINADKAFDLLRDHSQHNGNKLAGVASAIVGSHQLLMPAPEPIGTG